MSPGQGQEHEPRTLSQAGELLLDAEAAVHQGQTYTGGEARLDRFALSRSLSELAVAQLIHRGVVAIERLAAAMDRATRIDRDGETSVSRPDREGR